MEPRWGCFIGVDPGAAGAVACLDCDGSYAWVEDLPYVGGELDIRALARIWRKVPARPRVVVERQQSHPNTGRAAAFKIGQNYGRLTGFIEVQDNAQLILVTPAKWKQALHIPADKGKAIRSAQANWPAAGQDIQLMKHDGRAEALWLAEFGRLQP